MALAATINEAEEDFDPLRERDKEERAECEASSNGFANDRLRNECVSKNDNLNVGRHGSMRSAMESAFDPLDRDNLDVHPIISIIVPNSKTFIFH